MPVSGSLRVGFVSVRSIFLVDAITVACGVACAAWAATGIVLVAVGVNHESSRSRLRSVALDAAKAALTQTADKAIAATERIVDFIKVSRGIDELAPSSHGARIKPYVCNWQSGFRSSRLADERQMCQIVRDSSRIHSSSSWPCALIAAKLIDDEHARINFSEKALFNGG